MLGGKSKDIWQRRVLMQFKIEVHISDLIATYAFKSLDADLA
jgi:hypothetical protein